MDFSKLNETDVREEIIAPLVCELGYRSATEHNVLREQILSYPKAWLGRKDAKKDPLYEARPITYWRLVDVSGGSLKPNRRLAI